MRVRVQQEQKFLVTTERALLRYDNAFIFTNQSEVDFGITLVRFFIPKSVQSPEASCRHLWVAVKGTANPSSVLRRAVVARSLLPVQDSSIYTNSNYIISINSCRMSLTIVTREIFNSAVGLTHLNCHERQISDLILVYNQLCTYLWFFSRFCYRCG